MQDAAILKQLLKYSFSDMSIIRYTDEKVFIVATPRNPELSELLMFSQYSLTASVSESKVVNNTQL